MTKQDWESRLELIRKLGSDPVDRSGAICSGILLVAEMLHDGLEEINKTLGKPLSLKRIGKWRFSEPSYLASEGERIYNEQYRSLCEAQYLEKYVAIDVTSELAFIGDHPEKALANAKRGQPNGLFHLIKIGSAGAFRKG